MTRDKRPTEWEEVPIIIDVIYAARILGVTQETLKIWSHNDKGFPAYQVGKEWRVNKYDFIQWLAERQKGGKKNMLKDIEINGRVLKAAVVNKEVSSIILQLAGKSLTLPEIKFILDEAYNAMQRTVTV